MALTLLGGLAVKHLNEDCEQSTKSFSMATLTCCVLENGTVSMVHRGGEQTSAMLDWVKSKGRAALVLAMLLRILRSDSCQKRITDMQ